MKRDTLLAAGLLLALSLAVALIAPQQVDFVNFYNAGGSVLHGVNPYAGVGYYNPISVALAYAPVSLIPFEIAWRLNAGVMFALYVLALSRLFKRDRLWLAMLAPFAVIIAWYGNIDALVLLGATLPAPIGVWLLLTKPQIGFFAAALMLWQYRSWKLTAAAIGMLLVSLAMGMWQSSPLTASFNLSLWPFGLLVGLPLLFIAWRKRDTVIAMGATAFISPYVTALSWGAALPLLRARRWTLAIGVAASWLMFILWRLRF